MSKDQKDPQQTPAFSLPDAQAIRHWLLARLSEQLGISIAEIDPNEPLMSYGVGSAEAVSLSGELEEWLGRAVPATVAYDYPTVEGLARYLATEPTEHDRNAFVESTPAAEPIAIIGVGCRFPGAKDTEAFWRLLRDGEDAISEIPQDRWDVDTFYNEDPRVPGCMSTRWGGFLDRVDRFDSGFFGISPREASRMDPQQRLLLEVAWEALEDAGQAADRLAGTRTGVFVGISSNDYGQLQFNDPSLSDAYAGTGNALSIAANRISYLLNLHGPSLAVDTACSSSLVATHLACQSLQQGECQMALLGGVNVILSPIITVNFTKAGFMAPDGRCKAFDARANGYVRGEGAGVVLLKPLGRAMRDGDRVYAVIRGTAVNQDGRTNGITAPNGPAQERVLREAYRRAQISPGNVQYLEAHGTGTSLGDPIEANALGEVLAEGRVQGSCAIGSVKTNIGHLEAAAGIAGLIKVTLSLHNRMIPPSLHFEEPNPHIPFDHLPLHVQTQLTAWPDTSRPATAGVSSFGFGGTNAHVVLTGPPPMPESRPAVERPIHVLGLSAKTESALTDLARNYGAFLATHSSIPAGDLCFTASVGRSHFDHRQAVVAASSTELAAKLQRLVAGEQVTGAYRGQAPKTNHKAQLAFLFTGQGSQYVGMGKQLYASAPVFRDALERCAAILSSYDVPLIDLLYSEPTPNTEPRASNSELHQTRYTQPALFSLEYALAQLWQSWGIEPSMVFGHSVGEYAAACVAGVMDLEDGLKLIAHRGRLMQRLSEPGVMAAVFAPADTVEAALRGHTDRASVAAINGPENIVIAGARDTIARVLQELVSRGIESKPLKVSHAFHSPMMDPVLEEFERIAAEIPFREPRFRIVSNLTGQVIDRIDAAYWGKHLRAPVRFRTGMETLRNAGCEVFVEVGPDATLTAVGQRCVEGGSWLPSLRRKRDDWQQMLESLGQLYAYGMDVDWEAYARPYGARKVTLPTYPFQRRRSWFEFPAGPKDWGVLKKRGGDSNSVMHLLDQGNAEELAQRLEGAAQLTPDQSKQVQPLLRILIDQHQKDRQFKEEFGIEHLREPDDLEDAEIPNPEAGRRTALLSELERADSDQRRRTLVETYLRQRISRVLRMPADELDPKGDLTAYGLDSIMAMELVSEWRNYLRINFTPAEIFKRTTLRSVADYITEELTETREDGHEQLEAPAKLPRSKESSPAHGAHPPTDESRPLSSGQEGLWFFDQFVPQNPVYNETRAIRTLGELDLQALAETINEVVARHEILRTTFPAVKGRPTPHVQAFSAVVLPRANLEDLDSTQREEETARILQVFAATPFRLDQYPLFRTTLIQLREKERIFALSAHHIVCDGSSMDVFAREVSALYDAFRHRKPSPLQPLPMQYRDFVQWQRTRAARSEQYESHVEYWRNQLSGVSLDLHLPLDHQRPAAQTFRGSRLSIHLPRQLSDEIRALGDANGVTLFMTLLTSFKLLLSAFGGSSEVVVGTPNANRSRREVKDLIGFFVNTLILRTDLSGGPSFLELLERVRNVARGAYMHSEVPSEQLLAEFRPKRDVQQITLVQAGFGLVTPHPQPFEFTGLKTASLEIPLATAKTDLSLFMSDTPDGLSAIFEYSTDIFSAESIQRMADTFQLLLERVVADPSRPISDIGSIVRAAAPPTRQLENLHPYSNLTGNQLLIWLAQKLLPELPVFNVATALSVHGPVDGAIFRTAFQSLVDCTDTFRTVIHEVDGLPQQRAIDGLSYDLPCVDFSQESNPEATAQAWINERAKRPFRLAERTFDSGLLKISDEKYIWHFNQHHMLTDGWSVWLIHHRMTELYSRVQRGESLAGVSAPSFQEYVAFERRFRDSSDYREAELYWTGVISDPPEPLEFYGKTPRGHAAPIRRAACPLGPERSRLLRRVGRKANSSVGDLNPPEILFTALCAYLYLMCGNRRFTVGNMYHNRPHAFAETAGLFMQILPVRVDIESGETFASLAGKVKQSIKEGIRYGQFAVSNPLQNRAYDAVVNYLGMANRAEHGLGGAPVSFDFIHPGIAFESLCMRVTEAGVSGDFTADFQVRRDVFDEDDVRRTTRHFLRVLDAFLYDPGQQLDITELISAEERTQLVTGFNDTRTPLPANETFVGGFDAVVQDTPDRVAARCDDSVLTYATLDLRADQLGSYLRQLGVGAECMVAIYLHRSIEMLVAILAVWKAGAAYVPLDPKYPSERVQFMLADARARVLVTQSSLRHTDSFPTVDTEACHVLSIDSDWDEITAHHTPARVHMSPDNLAYSIYTSGSTGQPKGVMVHHRGMLNHLLAKVRELALSSTDVVAQTASQCFDISVWQFMAALLAGGSVRIYPDETAFDPLKLGAELERHDVSIFEAVPSLLSTMLREAPRAGQLSGLRWLVVTGETLPPDLVHLALRHHPRVPLLNAYGPTECSDDVTHFVMSIPPAESVTTVPIGHALANTQLFILHPGGYLAPLGNAGELCVGGLGVGRGYANDPMRTAAAFSPDPFASNVGRRLYRTGDRARHLANGDLLFLGRLDHQVKIRGFRIELGEIEAHLTSYPGIREAVVAVQHHENEQDRLVAYLVPQSQDVSSEGRANDPPQSKFTLDIVPQLRDFLQKKLPRYMVPSAFIMLEALPLTPNGKIDLKALRNPEMQFTNGSRQFVSPRTPVEEALAKIWAEVLGVERVGVHNDFFELGGHSLLAVQVISRVRDKFKIEIPVRHLFEATTVAGLAELVERIEWASQKDQPVNEEEMDEGEV